MVRIAANKIRTIRRFNRPFEKPFEEKKTSDFLAKTFVSPKAKMLAWAFFLLFFFENGTLGLIPQQLYFVYRNVRVSDLLIYGLIVYALWNSKEYYIYYNSKILLIFKLLGVFFLFEFIASSVIYDYSFIEYFFRLKYLWSTFLIFPFLLLIKRNGLWYLIKLIIPVSVISNILYIMTALTGYRFLPDINIALQTLPGGLQVYRVFGGTYFGEFIFLGIVYYWTTQKFKLPLLIPAILFSVPHILAFGRAAWLRILSIIILIFIWNIYRKKNFKIFIRQTIIIVVFGAVIIFGFMQFIPESSYISEALGARVQQGKEDYVYEQGTYGSRMVALSALLELWQKSNIIFGVGMHPMWVVKPVTVDESYYSWGFSDIRWAGVLAGYGLFGFGLVFFFQIQFIYASAKLMLKNKNSDLFQFFIIVAFSTFAFDTFVNYSYGLLSFAVNGTTTTVVFLASAVVCMYEDFKKKNQPEPSL